MEMNIAMLWYWYTISSAVTSGVF